jgi:hypothetical protein
LALLAPASPAAAQSAVRFAAGDEAKTTMVWIGRTREVEECLKRAEIVTIEDLGIGVTDPKVAHTPTRRWALSTTGAPENPGVRLPCR